MSEARGGEIAFCFNNELRQWIERCTWGRRDIEGSGNWAEAAATVRRIGLMGQTKPGAFWLVQSGVGPHCSGGLGRLLIFQYSEWFFNIKLLSNL
jgi:hypothetical protein